MARITFSVPCTLCGQQAIYWTNFCCGNTHFWTNISVSQAARAMSSHPPVQSFCRGWQRTHSCESVHLSRTVHTATVPAGLHADGGGESHQRARCAAPHLQVSRQQRGTTPEQGLAKSRCVSYLHQRGNSFVPPSMTLDSKRHTEERNVFVIAAIAAFRVFEHIILQIPFLTFFCF